MKVGPQSWIGLSCGLLVGAIDKTAFPLSGAGTLWGMGVGSGLGGVLGVYLLKRKQRHAGRQSSATDTEPA